jgi:hypothetical protein
MTLDEWKVTLKPAGILLACYLGAPVLGWLLGKHDLLFWHFAFSDLLQAGLGVVIFNQLAALKGPMQDELAARLEKPGHSREEALELSCRLVAAGGYIAAFALLLPPLASMFPDSSIMTLVKLCALGYTVYTSYAIWKLSEPFLTYHQAPAPEETSHEPHAAALGRCANCGQLIDTSMKVCAFCKHPVP